MVNLGVCKLIVKCQPRFAFQQWKTGQSIGIRAKKALIWISSMSASHWWYLFHTNVKTWDSRSWLEIGKSQPRSRMGKLNACPGWTVPFLGVKIGVFLKEGIKTHLMAPMSPLNLPTFSIVASIVYGPPLTSFDALNSSPPVMHTSRTSRHSHQQVVWCICTQFWMDNCKCDRDLSTL